MGAAGQTKGQRPSRVSHRWSPRGSGHRACSLPLTCGLHLTPRARPFDRPGLRKAVPGSRPWSRARRAIFLRPGTRPLLPWLRPRSPLAECSLPPPPRERRPSMAQAFGHDSGVHSKPPGLRSLVVGCRCHPILCLRGSRAPQAPGCLPGMGVSSEGLGVRAGSPPSGHLGTWGQGRCSGDPGQERRWADNMFSARKRGRRLFSSSRESNGGRCGLAFPAACCPSGPATGLWSWSGRRGEQTRHASPAPATL